MKTNLHAQERPRKKPSQTPLKSYYSPPGSNQRSGNLLAKGFCGASRGAVTGNNHSGTCMRPVLILIVAGMMGFVLRARAEDTAGVLVLDVYSVNVPSDIAHEKSFALWAKALKGGDESSREHAPVIHAVYRLAGMLNID